jgi:hypothetical protein
MRQRKVEKLGIAAITAPTEQDMGALLLLSPAGND